MAGYLIAVNGKISGVAQQPVLLGVDTAQGLSQAAAQTAAATLVTAYWLAKTGITPTNVVTLVSQTR